MRFRCQVAALAGAMLVLVPPATPAGQREELLEIRNTILNLVDELVGQGILTAERAEAMKREAALKAREDTARAAIEAGEAEDEAVPPAEAPGSVVRVPYVPEFVKDEIRAEVRAELRDEVTGDVVEIAREERWGTPDALPAWMSRVRFSGDGRMRYAQLLFDEGNTATFPNFDAINRAGGFVQAGQNAFLPVTEDFGRLQLRVRIAFDANLNEFVSLRTRFATGNALNPIGRNQDLGNYARNYDFQLEQGFLQIAGAAGWRPYSTDEAFADDEPPLYDVHQPGQLWSGFGAAVRAGRMPNPFHYTELVWDRDLMFDGISAQLTSPVFTDRIATWLTLGGFTLLAPQPNIPDGSVNDKYLLGGQLGFRFGLLNDVDFVLSGSYYDYVDIVGQRNEFNGNTKDWTAPPFIVKGNTLFDIRNSSAPPGTDNLFALAADFSIVDVIAQFEYTAFAPVLFILRGEYVQNVGYDEDEILARTGVFVEERATGYAAEFLLGHPIMTRRGDWSVFGAYRYRERDALVDAFVGSNLRAGGTDAEGWMLGFELGVARNAWMRVRWFTADEIDGPPLAVDIFQLDLSTRF